MLPGDESLLSRRGEGPRQHRGRRLCPPLTYPGQCKTSEGQSWARVGLGRQPSFPVSEGRTGGQGEGRKVGAGVRLMCGGGV